MKSRPFLSLAGWTALFALPLIIVLIVANTPQVITSNDDFFVVDIGQTPSINTISWTLQIDGDIDHPLTLTYAVLTAMPNVTEVETLECVDGPTATASWTGVPLNYILNLLGIHSDAESVVFYGADGYSTSLSLPNDNASDVILAWDMNGVPLPADHGYPLRLVVPNDYGYKWCKWITEISIVNYNYEGYWESRGYPNEAHIAGTGTTTDWEPHALLFSIAFLFGGLAMVSGVRLSKKIAIFDNFPEFVGRTFHIIVSMVFVASILVIYFAWTFIAPPQVSELGNSLHGIISVVTVGLILLSLITGIIRGRSNRTKKFHAW